MQEIENNFVEEKNPMKTRVKSIISKNIIQIQN